MSKPIEITFEAARRILELTEGKPGQGLRLYVSRGGCSGLQYNMEIAAVEPGDIVVEEHRARLYVDRQSQVYLQGSVVDYEDGLSGAGFRIRNPNATLTCGCGTSFTTQ
jgi:iron-sulfur cluster assembly accessory protein